MLFGFVKASENQGFAVHKILPLEQWLESGLMQKESIPPGAEAAVGARSKWAEGNLAVCALGLLEIHTQEELKA